MPRLRPHTLFFLVVAAVSIQCAQTPDRRWLAGDSHVHSHWSPGYDRTQNPPRFLKGEDAFYSTPRNALMAQRYGLSWMVTTDHGGPNHAKFNMTRAYAELELSRESVPGVLQFYGMELNMPGMDHHTLIIPNAKDEWSVLFEIESRFDKNEAWPVDPGTGHGGRAGPGTQSCEGAAASAAPCSRITHRGPRPASASTA